MKRKIILIIALVLGLATTAGAEGDIIINVVDGRFVSSELTVELADVQRPVEVGVLNGEVIVRLNTLNQGLMEVNLGRGQLALTDQAVQYIDIIPDEELTGALPEEMEICEICGRSMAFGYHKTLECGHYGCLVTLDHLKICSSCGKYTCDSKDHTPCEHCGIGLCSHVDLECEYTRNPAPTPFATKMPDGKVAYYVMEEDGSQVQGSPDGKPAETWDPGDAYVFDRLPPAMQQQALAEAAMKQAAEEAAAAAAGMAGMAP